MCYVNNKQSGFMAMFPRGLVKRNYFTVRIRKQTLCSRNIRCLVKKPYYLAGNTFHDHKIPLFPCSGIQLVANNGMSGIVSYMYDGVMKWKHFPRYWPFVHKGQWRGALMFSCICACINGLVNNRMAGDLRRHRAHYDISVMVSHKPPALQSTS